MKKMNIEKTWEVGSDNVFADLDMPDAKEKLVKADLIFKINTLIKRKKLKQIEVAALLQTDQAKISLLNRGHLSAFSIERLVKYLNLLHQDVAIVIKKTKHLSMIGQFQVIYT